MGDTDDPGATEEPDVVERPGSSPSETKYAALSSALNHPFLLILGAIATAGSIFAVGLSVGQGQGGTESPPPVGPTTTDTTEDMPTTSLEIVGSVYGRVSIDGLEPSEEDLEELSLRIQACDGDGSAGIRADVDAEGEFEVGGLTIGDEETCFRPVAEFLDNTVEGEEVRLDRTQTSARFPKIQLSSLPPGCENADDSLAIRFVESGVLATTSRSEAAQVAINEIRDTPGLLGPVLYEASSIINDPPTGEQVEELVADCVDALVTHLGSAASLEILPRVTEAGVIQFSPNSTSTSLSENDSEGLFFRTAPSDEIQGRVLARSLEADGKKSVAVVYLDDAYGANLKNEIERNFEGGAERRRIIAEFDFSLGGSISRADIESVTDTEPDAIVVIGYDKESAVALNWLADIEYDFGSVWLVDGNAKVNSVLQDPAILEGARQTIPGAETTGTALTSLRQRLGLPPGQQLDSFTAQTYDAVIILALAAAAADQRDSSGIANQINGVTRVGEKCTTYAECLGLIEDAVNIDYDGVGGPYDFTDSGEPYLALYRIDTYGPDGRPDPQLAEQGELETLCDICGTNEIELRVNFDDGSSVIAPSFQDTLSDIADLIRAATVETITIEGYASTSGSAASNLDLSQRRADAVLEYLVAQEGIPRNKLEAKGLGSTDEFIENRTVLFRDSD